MVTGIHKRFDLFPLFPAEMIGSKWTLLCFQEIVLISGKSIVVFQRNMFYLFFFIQVLCAVLCTNVMHSISSCLVAFVSQCFIGNRDNSHCLHRKTFTLNPTVSDLKIYTRVVKKCITASCIVNHGCNDSCFF